MFFTLYHFNTMIVWAEHFLGCLIPNRQYNCKKTQCSWGALWKDPPAVGVSESSVEQ